MQGLPVILKHLNDFMYAFKLKGIVAASLTLPS